MSELTGSNAAQKRIAHLIAERPKSLSEFLHEDMKLSSLRCEELLGFGAVYVNKKREKGADFLLARGDYIRVHKEPKRYPVERCEHSELILFEDDEILVCNKPSGVPVHAMLDNDVENLSTFLKRKVGYQVFACHRIDNDTKGLVVFAKSKETGSKLKKIWTSPHVKKFYLVETMNRPELGPMTHYLKLRMKPPHLFLDNASEEAKFCNLNVIKLISESRKKCISLVQLNTGRTHQIRGQFAAAGCPVIGDNLYGDTPGGNEATASDLGLTSFRIDIDFQDEKGQKKTWSYSFALPFP